MFNSWRIVDKNRSTPSRATTITVPRVPWVPTVPTAEPWRSAYLALSVEQQKLWDALSPAARRSTFGV